MTDKQSSTPRFINSKRRGFLQGAAVAGGAVTSGAVLGGESLVEAIDQVQITDDKSTGKKGYERTEHVSRYYARARI
ncbi:twin-arginine translocation signal domain-containing protein [Granulosicoccus antarcticus]|uniref:Formate dehydrogenase region TAT target n=1 Tax=Granulosicoccus antarcticus IMCC3135 TaxID=1192854 RepID=A0A2Z2P5K5_9GAMM|nr:twin-arginine translocation signal domain-containing protein [Granulosicoccus antarcticus]ASJ75114.1 hypothetical protein IMCC3135_25255 [Granulosicoccus antarcticus IMCC3135]